MGMTHFDVLLSVTLYRDGQVRIDGHPREGSIPFILREIAAALDDGALVLSHEEDPHDD